MDPATVALVRASLEETGPAGDALAGHAYAGLFAARPEVRALFPAGMAEQRRRLLDGLRHVAALLDDTAALDEFLLRLGRDHQRLRVTPDQLTALGRALQVAVREVVPHAWTEETGDAWRTVLDHVVDVMARGCADTTDDPARRRTWEATVVSRERVAEDLAVVRLQVHRGPEDGPGDPVPALAAGQHLQVETARRPGMWRRFSPATAPGPDGQVELHVRAVPGGWVSGAVVAHAAPGERWRVAAPAGSLRVDRASGRDVLMLAGGTGLAPLRSLVLDLARTGGAPRVHLFVGARHPGDLYDLELLGRVATANPWLTVVPVVESTSAPWGRFPVRERPPGVAVTLVGRLVDVVTGFGAWDDRQALVCGSRAMVRASVAGLVAAGMPAHQVWRDPLGGGPEADARGRHRRPGTAAG